MKNFQENALKNKAQFPLLMFGLELITYSLLNSLWFADFGDIFHSILFLSFYFG